MTDSVDPNATNNVASTLLPRLYRTDANKKFLQATVEQMSQKGTVTKLNGFIGRKSAKATLGSDIFIEAANSTRQNYQLEPAVVINDKEGNTRYFKDYQDYINKIKLLGGNVSNHQRLNSEESYSWDPQINWDKFVNFQNYYWLTPSVINVQDTVDVEQDILGKPTYTLDNGYSLSNGMLISFAGNVSPIGYTTGEYYVEGVGTTIQLIPATFIDTTSNQHEYILINKASYDKNPWSRANRWVHTDVLNISDNINNTISSLDQSHRAIRPIIEFSANIKLFNYGTEWLIDVDLLDTYTTDAFSVVEGSSEYHIDNILLIDGQYVIFSNDTDLDVKNNVYKVSIVSSLIHLELIATPVLNQVIYIKSGIENSSKYMWFNGISWITAQQKTGVNNAPLFDVIDENQTSIGDISVYNGSSFKGTYVFSYKVGTGIADTELKFPLSYRNINNIGDIVFNFDFVTDTFSYKEVNQIVTKNISKGYLLLKDYNKNDVYTNGWKKSNNLTVQPGIRVYKGTGISNNFNIDIFDDNSKLNDLEVRVYINGIRLQRYTISNTQNWMVVDTPLYKQVVFLDANTNIMVTDTDYTNNVIAISNTTNLTIGQKVVFADNIGNILSNNVYYITSMYNTSIDISTTTFDTITTFDDNTTFDAISVPINAITISKTLNGPDVILTTINSVNVALYALSDIQLNDVLTIKTFAAQPINTNGYYEIPNNLQNNPLNGIIQEFTLGEVINHVDSIVDNLSTSFVGIFPGFSNLRDLGNISPYGTKFVKHSGPSGISLYHITSDTVDITRAIEQSRDDYNNFKRNFILVAETLGVDTTIKLHVDLILQNITKNMSNKSPYYFSDMVPFGASIKTSYTIGESIINQFSLVNKFNNSILSNQAVGVYVNDEQLLINHEYIINNQEVVEISLTLNTNDIVTIYEYENTDGSCIPETPTKLGIWPLSDPKIYQETSFITPQWIIQGHDGSQVLAYGTYGENGTPDYRDLLILELEKRIYNNIKIKYNSDIFNISDVVPRYAQISDYNMDEFNAVLAPSFYKWTSLVDVDFTNPIQYDSNNPFTYNFTGHSAPDGRALPGYWRGIYRWMYDTERPHTCPWELLGVTDKPEWWDTVYGSAPYTSTNLSMWEDISNGLLNDPVTPTILPQYIKTYLMQHIPVDTSGNLINPLDAGLVQGILTDEIKNNYVFGDVGPVESAWRRSSHYPFSVILTSLLLTPSKTLGTILDLSRISKNLTGQLVYNNSGLHISPSAVVLPSIATSDNRVQTSGIVNYIVNHVIGGDLSTYNQYAYDLSNISYNTSYRIGGFTSKDQFNLILDSKSPLTTGNIFIPKDDYSIILNTSSPTKKITYSGVIISKLYNGYGVKGYSKTQPYFIYYPWIQSGSAINVGGISENFVIWTVGQSYNKGQIVKYANEYFRATVVINGETTFDTLKYQRLSSLPMVGGRTVLLRKAWDKTSPITIPYNSTFDTIQEVVDFLIGYGEWLKDQGFIFDDFNTNLNQVSNWVTSAKEFMFWTTQNWTASKDTWTDWLPNTKVLYNSIVRYEDNYFRALRNIDASSVFHYEFYEKLDGLSNIGSSVISLSPAANSISFSTPLNVVDDITNKFNDYEMLRVDGNSIPPHFLKSSRDKNLVTYSPSNDDGIYNASFYLVQKEQVVIINNTTMFNDLIYDPTSGYKQDRIKLSAYVTSDWYGGFDTPGFIFDEATITKWIAWKDYTLGDIVQYQSFYYSANSFITGSDTFDNTKWVKLQSRPTSKILPNWTNIATQFLDFYKLDDEHFDSAQQTMAQHLIGYQKRQYLNNIIQDDVSEFKFYQGMISEKGTQNVFNKLFGVLAAEQKESLTFYEEWAVRVGQYGASSAFNEVEFILPEEKFKDNPQSIELVDNKSKVSGHVIQQIPTDVYLRPYEYKSNLFPIVTSNKRFLRSAGYVRPSDVLVTVKNISDILTQDITKFSSGDYVWCTFESTDWNVYRYTPCNFVVSDVTYASNELTINVDKMLDIVVGDYIGIANVINFSGFYKVISYVSNVLIVSASNIAVASPFIQQNTIKLYYFTTQRANSMDNANNILQYPLKNNELLWTDNNGVGKWATWEYNPVYNGRLLPNPYPTSQTNYGRNIASNDTGNTAVISTAAGDVYVYNNFKTGKLSLRQILSKPFISLQDQNPISAFGEVVAIARDNSWIAVGSPTISNACTVLTDLNITFDDNDLPFNTTQVTFDNYAFYQPPLTSFIKTTYDTQTTFDNNTIFDAKSTIQSDSLIPTDISGFDSSFTNQGVVSLYKIDKNNSYYHIVTFVSPQATSNEFFGASLEFGDKCLYIGAPGGNNNNGKVYKINYDMIVNATAEYDPINSAGTTLQLVSSPGINVVGMYVVGTGFNSNQQVLQASLSNTTLTLNANPDTQPSGILQFVNYEWKYDRPATITGTTPGDKFGSQVKISNDNTLVISSVGSVNIYKSGIFLQTLGGQTPSFGTSITISKYGSYIAISDSLYSGNTYAQQGNVQVYTRSSPTSQYTLYQTIDNLYPAVHSEFGTNISFMDDYDTLVIHSKFANSTSGIVNVYDRYNTKWIFSEQLSLLIISAGAFIIGDSYTILSIGSTDFTLIGANSNTIGETFIATGVGSGTGTAVINIENDDNKLGFCATHNTILIGTPYEYDSSIKTILAGRFIPGNAYIISSIGTTDFTLIGAVSNMIGETFVATGVGSGTGSAKFSSSYINSGLVFEYVKLGDVYSWSIKHQEIDKPDVNKIKKAFLYNKKSDELITYLDVIDPLQGKIPGIAEQELSYKTFYDPAVYSVGDSSVNVDASIAWNESHVGKLWWDVRTAKFTEANDSDINYRHSTWNTLVYGASIDIYEWVETKLLPSVWDAQADTDAGLALNISGKSLYGDACYSAKPFYDNISKTERNTYYFWVKNRAIVPSIPGRYTPAYSIANLISSPLKDAYKYIAITSQNTIEVANAGPLLSNNDVVLSIQYWLIDKIDQNIHSQWKLISNAPTTTLPKNIEQKWFDSLCGVDLFGNIVPDRFVSEKLKYGVENRPIQSMFINRFEAIKELIEHANIVLLQNQITSTRNLVGIQQYDQQPSISSGLYDITINTDSELLANIPSSYSMPSLSANITDGKITSVTILSAGMGYIGSPNIEVIGTGKNAILRCVINTGGEVIDVIVENSGDGYDDDNTVIKVRRYAVLVLNDSQSNNSWSIYSYNVSSNSWFRTLNKSYDTRDYWYYVDWYATGYNQFTAIDYSVNLFTELPSIQSNIGDTIKVRMGNNDKWMLLKRYSSIETIDWTKAYNIIGMQSGTIQIDSKIYNSAHYDGNLYDSTGYDINPSTELYYILTALKDDIFINDLKTEYLNLFFNSVRYAHTEQKYIDWIFKTSFVKAKHNVGTLHQPVTYKNDSLIDFENYVAEVKPYRTQVREYISSYTRIN